MQYLSFKNFQDFCFFFQISNITKNTFFQDAMTHSSVSKKHNYEKLEFLGDTILNFCISNMLFNLFPDDREGELSKKKSFLVSRKVCLSVAKDINLQSQVRCMHVDMDNVLADILEALISVIYQEYDIDKIYYVVCNLFKPYLSNNYIDDPKMKLQEFTQKKYQCLPRYEVIEKQGQDDAPIFKIKVYAGSYFSIGVGKNKKEAEKQGAEKLLKKMKLI